MNRTIRYAAFSLVVVLSAFHLPARADDAAGEVKTALTHARHNVPRIGRILIAHGRYATDVALVTSFGPHQLVAFNVVTDKVKEQEPTFAHGGRVA